VIASFKDQATQDIFDGANTPSARRIPGELWKVVVRKLDMLEAAHEIKDLKSPPGNRLEALKGKMAGKFIIRVNDQYRVTFSFEGGNATEVMVSDYHSGGKR